MISNFVSLWAFSAPKVFRALQTLLLNLHQAFPPVTFRGRQIVSPHPYFARHSPILPTAVTNHKGIIRSLRRVRFFLHPDKLPPNFDVDQLNLCKALWDIINEVSSDMCRAPVRRTEDGEIELTHHSFLSRHRLRRRGGRARTYNQSKTLVTHTKRSCLYVF